MNIPEDAFYALLIQALRDRGDETLQRTLYGALREAILQGQLQAHSRLPGSRTLAQQLELSRNTINAVLDQLATEGFLLRDRQGSRVCELPKTPSRGGLPEPECVLPPRLLNLLSNVRRDTQPMAFTPGLPALNHFPLPLWRRLLDGVLRKEGSALLGYGDPAGDETLRIAIARHLALSRGIQCHAGQIVITDGALEGVNLCLQLLSEPGERVWLEEPGYLGARSAFISHGLHIEGMPVDEEGICFPLTTHTPPRLIFSSPSHQYPLGSVLSARRRLALLAFAREHRAWIIEDDYDSEFRFRGEPVPAMAGMLPHAPVLYLGTFSKTLFPSLRIGFVVMPEVMAKQVQPTLHALLRGGHRAEQRALARFIEEGHYVRHLAAMRRLYRARHEALRETLEQTLTEPHVIAASDGGLHLTVQLEGIDDRRVTEQARHYQLAPAPLSQYYLNPAESRSGVVLGYGNTSASQFAPALRILNRIIVQAGRGSA